MTATIGARRLLTGTLTVPLPPDRAFRLFTPRGERDWAAGWEPRFPAGTGDDTEPGTVFETASHGQTTTWVVVERVPGERMRYARVVPGESAGTVTVDLAPGPEGSIVSVGYSLTPLGPAGERHLAEFAAGYPAYLRSWADAIGTALAGGATGAAPDGRAEVTG